MNILHYVESTDSRMGGVPRFVLDDSRVMAQRGHPSTILTLDTTDTPSEWLDSSEDVQAGNDLPRVIKLARPSLGGTLFGPLQLRAVRAEVARADVVHLHCVWSPSTFQIAVVARQMNVPYVVSLHGMLDDWSMDQGALKKKAFMALGGTRLLERAARVHSTATAELDQSNKWFPKGRAAIIPYLMDLEPYRHLPGADLARQHFAFLNDGEPTFLFLSRLHYKKGCEHLLRAAAQHIAAGRPGKFVFAGTGDEQYVESLRTLAADLNITHKVHFVGQVCGDLKLSLYEASDCFVLPTSQENFGLVLVEAMMCRTPVITTKGVDIWKDLLDSEGAAVVDQTADALATAMAQMTADPAKLSLMGEKARRWVFDTFSEDSLVSRYEQFYRTCASTGGNAPAHALPPRGRLATHAA
jgi:glycosyltransferase involved in cell wall biosynthesis